MPWKCMDCGARWKPGAPCCPECRSKSYLNEEEDMPKATVEGGASDYQAGAPEDAATAPAPEQPAVEAPSARASKAELVGHAVNVAGVDAEVAQAMTKTELAELIAARAVPGD